jgi:hypothetical protein
MGKPHSGTSVTTPGSFDPLLQSGWEKAANQDTARRFVVMFGAANRGYTGRRRQVPSVGDNAEVDDVVQGENRNRALLCSNEAALPHILGWSIRSDRSGSRVNRLWHDLVERSSAR